MNEISAAGAKVYSDIKSLVVRAKTNGGMRTFNRSRHKLIFDHKLGSAKQLNTSDPG